MYLVFTVLDDMLPNYRITKLKFLIANPSQFQIKL